MSEFEPRLPNGMCCRVCALFAKCEALFGCNPASQSCDFYPVRFSISPKRFLQECTESDKLRAEIAQIVAERDILLKTRDLMGAEINRLNGAIVDLNDEHNADLTDMRAGLVDLVKIVDASVYGEDGIHHHTCPAPDHGKCTCGCYEVMNKARSLEYMGMKHD